MRAENNRGDILGMANGGGFRRGDCYFNGARAFAGARLQLAGGEHGLASPRFGARCAFLR